MAAMLPEPLRPKLIAGYGMAGICLIRLRDIRPRFVPSSLGITSENAAHRIAVQWNGDQEGVFIPRRDTSSWLNSVAGGRIFPGVHHRSRFAVREEHPSYSITIADAGASPILQVQATVAGSLPTSSLFATVAEASRFFEAGSVGFSPSRRPDVLDALELRTHAWSMEPLEVASVASSFFADSSRFPPGNVQFDSAFLMRHVEHEWHSREPLCCGRLRRAA